MSLERSARRERRAGSSGGGAARARPWVAATGSWPWVAARARPWIAATGSRPWVAATGSRPWVGARARPCAAATGAWPWIAVALAVALGSACAKEIQDPRSADVDFGDPKSVVASVFFAAEHGSAAHLAGLCDPTGAANPAARRVCAARPSAPDWGSFRRAFARGRLNGEPRVHGDRATLDFVFGPTGQDSETMELVRRDGRWYLSGF